VLQAYIARFELTLEKEMIGEYRVLLDNVINELKASSLYHTTQESKMSENSISIEAERALFTDLQEALRKQSPGKIKPLFKELSALKLSKESREIFEKIETSIKRYKYKDALAVLESDHE
jgi:hypothetical protein